MEKQFENKPLNVQHEEYRKHILKTLMNIYETNEDNLSQEDKKFFNYYSAHLRNSIFISQDAGMRMGSFILGSNEKPDSEYKHSENISSPFYMEIIRKHFGNKISDSVLFSKTKKEFSSMCEKEVDGELLQFYYGRRLREDGSTVVEEGIGKPKGERDFKGTGNIEVTDLKSGYRINFNLLLPKNHHIIPSELVKEKNTLSPEKIDHDFSIEFLDIDNYKGTKGSEGIFYNRGELTGYGDLTKNGNILSLLHEISHAWQRIYYSREGRGEFDNFYDAITKYLLILHNLSQSKEDGVINKEIFIKLYLAPIPEMRKQGIPLDENALIKVYEKLDLEKYEEHLVAELNNLGIIIDKNDFIYKGQRLDTNSQWVIMKNLFGTNFVVKIKGIRELISNFEKEERQAWAHALLMLRFFKKCGVDLEPELKSFTDFKEYINPCLDSYQKYIESKVEIVGDQISFLKREK